MKGALRRSRAQLYLDRYHVAPWTHLSRHDGQHADDERKTKAPRRDDGRSDCRLRRSAGRCALGQAEGDIKTAAFVVLGYEKAEAASISRAIRVISVV